MRSSVIRHCYRSDLSCDLKSKAAGLQRMVSKIFFYCLCLLPLSGNHIGKGSKKALILQGASLEMFWQYFDTLAK